MKHGFQTTSHLLHVGLGRQPSFEAVICQRKSGTTDSSNYKCDEQSTG
jgi:hypothetical protein